jgi:hypothetical protein
VLPYQRLEHNPQVAELRASDHKRSKRRATCCPPAPASSRFRATLGMTNRCRKARGRKSGRGTRQLLSCEFISFCRASGFSFKIFLPRQGESQVVVRFEIIGTCLEPRLQVWNALLGMSCSHQRGSQTVISGGIVGSQFHRKMIFSGSRGAEIPAPQSFWNPRLADSPCDHRDRGRSVLGQSR